MHKQLRLHTTLLLVYGHKDALNQFKAGDLEINGNKKQEINMQSLY